MQLATHNYTVTLVSPKTGDHRTFRIRTLLDGELEGRRIAEMLVGSDNEEDFLAFAFVTESGAVITWRKHRGTVYERFADLLAREDYWTTRGVQYLAEGRCRRCNRKLTTPGSIESGIGPICAEKEFGTF